MTLHSPERLPTGIDGLDTILRGGLPAHRAYLVQGSPGTGKTTLALQFLVAGVDAGQTCVYVSFSESRAELDEVAAAHNWPLDDIEVCELAAAISERATAGSSIFHAADVDLPEAITTLREVVERVKPQRLAVDSLTELFNMAESHRHFRRALFELKVFLEEAGVTTIFVGEHHDAPQPHAATLAHGVIRLATETPLYGPARRRLEVCKLRASEYDSGLHDFEIVAGGLEVYPRIRPKEQRRSVGNGERIISGVESLDRLMGGGLDRGTTSLFIGESGTGKSTVLIQYALESARRGENALIFTFDEDVPTIERRAAGMGISLEEYIDSGRICIQSVDSAEMSPGQFAFLVRKHVQERDVAFVAIDSVNGYMQAMPNERALIPHLHDLMTWLGGQGIVMILVMTLGGMLREPAPVAHMSYLADSVVYLRFFEQAGAVHKSITVVKHRTSAHERYIRELTLGDGGIHVGEPLTNFTNVFHPKPTFEGAAADLSQHRDDRGSDL